MFEVGVEILLQTLNAGSGGAELQCGHCWRPPRAATLTSLCQCHPVCPPCPASSVCGHSVYPAPAAGDRAERVHGSASSCPWGTPGDRLEETLQDGAVGCGRWVQIQPSELCPAAEEVNQDAELSFLQQALGAPRKGKCLPTSALGRFLSSRDPAELFPPQKPFQHILQPPSCPSPQSPPHTDCGSILCLFPQCLTWNVECEDRTSVFLSSFFPLAWESARLWRYCINLRSRGGHIVGLQSI
ncbi:uncharacterized protein LOC110349968 [Heterocephalus glaber]|uniref:Uncharacterized protein LOC110349968 n=1 Tax=Heterocephalus glaber TaxID=10181 RepID=A0AAX6T878_HETGA|nr:uncharacterized protein LOC110349968 [Heterocephalus glaber]